MTMDATSDTTLDGWVTRIGDQFVPVLDHSINRLCELCAQEEPPIGELITVVEQDPGLTVHLLRTCNSASQGRLRTEITSVQQALMMMGTDKVSHLPDDLPAVNKTLEGRARNRLLKTFNRAYHAARQATDWAGQRRDMTAAEVFAATQLHFLGEMMLSMFCPEKLDQVDEIYREKHIASEEAQYLVLGFTLDQLTLELATKWKLPSLVIEALQSENAQYPRAFGIMLAVQLARGAIIDWYGEKTLRIQKQAAEWLDIEVDELVANTHQLAVKVAHNADLYEVSPAAARLPLIPVPIAGEALETTNSSAKPNAGICLIPQFNIVQKTANKLGKATDKTHKVQEIITLVLQGMHDGIGLNRVVFATLNKEDKTLAAQTITGAENDPIFNRFHVSLKKPNLFVLLLRKTQAILINNETRSKYWSMVPEEFRALIKTDSFMAMSLFVDEKLVGLLYADRHTSDCQLDDRSYKYFKSLTLQTTRAMEKLSTLDI